MNIGMYASNNCNSMDRIQLIGITFLFVNILSWFESIKKSGKKTKNDLKNSPSSLYQLGYEKPVPFSVT